MPELPDVEGFRRVVDDAAGHPVDDVDVLDAGVLRDTTTAALRKAAKGRAFGKARRHGKWLVCPLHEPRRRHRSDEPSVIFHFGMTGELSWAHDEDRHKHDRVVFVTVDGELRYRDMRKLHGLRLAPDDGAVDDLLADVGPDAGDVSRTDFRERVGRTRRALKPALMDQSVVAGLGNLLVDEILWRARIHPTTSTRDLSEQQWKDLHTKTQSTLRDALPTGRVPPRPSWLTGHRDDPDGRCPRCDTPLRHTTVGGRNTAWCPNCQRS